MVDPGVVEELIRMCILETSQKAAYPMQISEYLMSIQTCVVIAVLRRTKLRCRELTSLDRAFLCTQEKTERGEMAKSFTDSFGIDPYCISQSDAHLA